MFARAMETLPSRGLGEHAKGELIGIAVARLFAEALEFGFFEVIVPSAKGVILSDYIVNHSSFLRELFSRGVSYFVLLENTPFFAAGELASFSVLPSIDGVAHRRHFESG